MLSRFKVLMIGLGAMLTLSVAWSGGAQAARPVQPQFTKGGETIKSNLTIEGSSGRARLWEPELLTVFRCEKTTSVGTIGPKGLGNGAYSYNECKIFVVKENTMTKQYEEGEENTPCKLKKGEIKTKPMKSLLVWAKSENIALVLHTAIEKEIVGLEIEGTGCTLDGTLPLEGGLLSLPTRVNQEATTGFQAFDVLNGNKEIRQHFREYEVEREGGVKESGRIELTIKGKGDSFENLEQAEIVKQGTKSTRGLFGIRE